MTALDDTAEYFETGIGTIEGIDTVIIGQYDLEDILGNVNNAVIIAPITEEADLELADGVGINVVGINVPWHITLGVTGHKNEATMEVLRLVPLIQAELAKDMTQGGTCTESVWAKPRVIYDANVNQNIGPMSAARLIIITTYSD